jgi:hypothetical protein
VTKLDIPNEWYLGDDPRYKRQNMERAMRGKIERGLVELITNSDDSYRDLEEGGKQVSGKMRIEIERKRKAQPSIVMVRDRASGMTREELFEKLGILGKRTSGFEMGKARRGLHGRGARDVACFGTVHFESIKDNEYNHLIIPRSLKCHFTHSRPQKVDDEMRKRLGIPKGNGTMVTMEVDSQHKVPQHETLIESFACYYSLRDIFSNPSREITLLDINAGREDRLRYSYPIGEIVFDKEIDLPEYSDVKAHLIIRKYATPFQQDTISPYREGILVKSVASIHDCTYFGLEAEPFAWRFNGEVRCDFIDTLVRKYDDRDDANPDHPNHPLNNPIRILDPLRDGLLMEHPFTRALYKQCKGVLKELIEKMKAVEAHPKKDVTNENLNRKLNKLSKEISPILEKKLKELEEEIAPRPIEEGLINKLDTGLHIIPPEEIPIIVNESKTFSIIVKHHEPLDESLPIDISSSNDDIKLNATPVYLKKFSDDRKVARTTFTVSSSKVGVEAFIEARYDGYSNLVLVKIVEQPPPPELPEGLSFDKTIYRLKINKEKSLILWLKANISDYAVPVEVMSDHPEIIIKGGGRLELHRTDTSGVLIGKCRILGRQLKARGTITAQIKGFGPAKTRAVVENPPILEFRPVEENFGSVRYKWDDENPYLLKIAAKHPSISRYLGDLINDNYPGINSRLYHTVLAEVASEALAFNVLERQFKREGDQGKLDYTYTDAYYHKHFSDFLAIAHRCLVTEITYN